MSHQIAKRWFSVDEFYRMAEAGILTADDRVELIEGEIIEMSPIGSRHAACVNRLNTLLSRQLGQAAIISIQNPIRIDDYSEPEPDAAVLKPREDFYAVDHPTPGDVLLVVEVADTSVEYDRKIKLPLYARASVPEVWLVNLPQATIEIYRQPLDGTYREIHLVKHGESLVSQVSPNLTLEAVDILG
ncbi:MAG: Uma2 family endonuclease [Pyrinomonadaceae bacterium]|nr:Uma2 family endonuclease [Pyrinomonadaceae bacterium]